MKILLDNIVVLGIIASIIYYEITEISPGGIIVPGYMVLFLNQPIRIFVTLILSISTLYIVKLLAGYTILYGKRKFALMIIISFIIGSGIDILRLPVSASLIIGCLIPGIIAHNMDRQGIIKTFSSLSIVTITLKFVVVFLRGVNIV